MGCLVPVSIRVVLCVFWNVCNAMSIQLIKLIAFTSSWFGIEDPEEIQLKIFRSMTGLENVDIVRPGYDVEYGE